MATEQPSQVELIKTIKRLTFIVETTAHLQGRERELLPVCEQARRLVRFYEPEPEPVNPLGDLEAFL